MSEVQMIVHCLWCNAVWDVDHDPESCMCGTDVDWVLTVVDDYENPYPEWLERNPK
jgi:hypothetical protein